jgi:hypothetical protein
MKRIRLIFLKDLVQATMETVGDLNNVPVAGYWCNKSFVHGSISYLFIQILLAQSLYEHPPAAPGYLFSANVIRIQLDKEGAQKIT